MFDGGENYLTINFPGAKVSVPTSINDHGDIVGVYGNSDDDSGHGFLFSEGLFSTIDFPSAEWTSPKEINNSGQIVGTYQKSGKRHGFLLDTNGFRTIDFPGAFDTELNDINDAGQVLGYASGVSFVFDKDTFSTLSPNFPGNFSWRINDFNNNGQIVGDYYSWNENRTHGFLATPGKPKLFVTIPGINDNGAMMLEGAKKIVRYDGRTLLIIRELAHPSETSVRNLVTEISKEAKKIGKDVVVLIDMDLEGYTMEFPLPPFLNRWKRSVSWAGKMANIVSDAFSKEGPGGRRILYAHSAGGDATYQTILQAPRVKGKRQRMYDDINIFNGRTSAVNLKNALKRGGYNWRQVKVFTNRGDCPANPFWALANYDVVKRYAGASWVHLHCCEIITCTDPLSFCGCHSALRDSIPDGSIGTFEVNLSPKIGTLDCTEAATVKDLMTRDWR